MKWCESITMKEPLRDVHLLIQVPVKAWPAHLREREHDAYQRGWRDCEAALGERASRQQNEILEQVKQLTESLRQTVPQVIRETEMTLIHLALEAAQKVVGGMPVNAEMIESVVREAVHQVEDTAGISIQLNPEDLELLRNNESAILHGLPETGPLKFTGSLQVTRGGCLVQTRFGVIDARRETKMEQLRQTLAI